MRLPAVSGRPHTLPRAVGVSTRPTRSRCSTRSRRPTLSLAPRSFLPISPRFCLNVVPLDQPFVMSCLSASCRGSFQARKHLLHASIDTDSDRVVYTTFGQLGGGYSNPPDVRSHAPTLPPTHSLALCARSLARFRIGESEDGEGQGPLADVFIPIPSSLHIVCFVCVCACEQPSDQPTSQPASQPINQSTEPRLVVPERWRLQYPHHRIPRHRECSD